LEALRASLAPKSRFSFKRNPARLSASITPPASLPPAEPAEASKLLAHTSSTSAADLALSSYAHRYLTSEFLAECLLPASLAISDLDGCIVNLLPSSSKVDRRTATNSPSLSAIHIRNVTNTMLLLPVVKGSVLLHDISSCVIVVGCHQV
jgi:tubulin-specific chaperone C